MAGPRPISKTPVAPPKEDLAATVRANPTYLSLTGDAKKHADAILSFAEKSPKREYYLSKLLLLLNTPDNPPAATSESQTKRIDESVKKAAEARALPKDVSLGEAVRLTVERFVRESEEEVIANGASRRYETLTSKDWGKTYLVDRRDPKNIVVKSKVRIDGSPEMKAKIALLEDAIEKHARIKGYTADLQFVDYDGPDVFTVKADPTGWTTERNWVGAATSLAHEWGHQLGLDDEYDYIESHAANRNMKMATRLYWFTVEMNRVVPADGKIGMMSASSNKPLDRHACEIAQLDVDECVTTRIGKPYKKFGPIVPMAPKAMPSPP